MRIIGLTGKAGAGKDFVGRLIKREYEADNWELVNLKDGEPFCVELAAFAAPLKDTVAAMFCIDRSLMDSNDGKASATSWLWDDVCNICHPGWRLREEYKYKGRHITVRELLQFIGTDLVRNCWNEKHWIQCAGQRMAKSNADIYVFTDCRFENEAAFVRLNGGEVWEVTGRSHDNVPQHASEQRTFQVDYTVDNSPGTTVEQLIRQIGERLEVVKG
jgi:hypothetical protein